MSEEEENRFFSIIKEQSHKDINDNTIKYNDLLRMVHGDEYENELRKYINHILLVVMVIEYIVIKLLIIRKNLYKKNIIIL